IRRMRRLAEVALTAYDLGEVRLTPLQHFFNTTFCIDTCSPAGKRERYVIRIHRPGSQDTTTIRSELLWLLALRHEEGLIVPEPVSTRDGSLLTTASVAGVPEPRDCVGAFMVRLHNQAENYVVPAGFFRKSWDYEGLRSGVLGTDLEQSWAHLSPEEHQILDEVGERVQHTMHSLVLQP